MYIADLHWLMLIVFIMLYALEVAEQKILHILHYVNYCYSQYFFVVL